MRFEGYRGPFSDPRINLMAALILKTTKGRRSKGAASPFTVWLPLGDKKAQGAALCLNNHTDFQLRPPKI